MYSASTVIISCDLLKSSTTFCTVSEYCSSSACHHLMVIGSVTSYRDGSTSATVCASVCAPAPALPVEPPPLQPLSVPAIIAATINNAIPLFFMSFTTPFRCPLRPFRLKVTTPPGEKTAIKKRLCMRRKHIAHMHPTLAPISVSLKQPIFFSDRTMVS